MRLGRRSGIGRFGFALLVILILVGVGVTFLLYAYESNAGRPKAAVLLGTTTSDCKQIPFHVQNLDTRILHGWSVVPAISPADSHIRTSPSNFPIEPLAPQGNSSLYSFNVTLAGAPTGIYQLQLNLINGSATIASSPSIGCKV